MYRSRICYRFKSVKKALKVFHIPKSTFYKWKMRIKNGEDRLLRKHPIANNHPNKIKLDIIDKVLSLRKGYQI